MAGKAGKNPLLHDCKRLFHYAGAVYIIGSVDNHFVGIEQAHKVCKADAQVFCAVVYGAEGFPIARFREAREGFELLKLDYNSLRCNGEMFFSAFFMEYR